MKEGNPSYTNAPFKKIFKNNDIQINTAKLITGNDTLIGYFGQVTLIKQQKKVYYTALGTPDSLLFLAAGFNVNKDSLGYLNAELELGLSTYTTEKINLSVKYNPESMTVLYKWNNNLKNSGNIIEIKKGNIEIGMECPDIKVQMLNGPEISLKGIKDKILVLNFWHTKCGPCIKEIPSLNQIAESFKTRKDVTFLAICDSPEKDLKDFLENTTFSYKQCISTPSIIDLLRNNGYPQHIIINKNGKVAFYMSGGGKETGKEIKTVIDKLTDN